ncbi:MAG: UTRA domain-containing protein [Lachnospiraceae bacterium]|nr:UTRA domain-containing protein [Lachnospiraceae bacterium]
MKDRGLIPSSEIESIELTKETHGEIREKLEIGSEEKLYRIVRIRYGNNIEMAYEITYVPYSLCPNLQQHLHEKTSLYNIYTGIYGLRLSYGNVFLEAEMPKQDVQEKLHLPKRIPVLKMHCTGYSEENQPIYYVECYYSGDKYVFSTTTVR